MHDGRERAAGLEQAEQRGELRVAADDRRAALGEQRSERAAPRRQAASGSGSGAGTIVATTRLDRVGGEHQRVGVAQQRLRARGLVDAERAEGPVVLGDDVGADPADLPGERPLTAGKQSVAAASSSSESQARVRGTM